MPDITDENGKQALAEFLINASREMGPFEPYAFLNVPGGEIVIYLADEATYSEWLNPWFSVTLTQDSNEVVGAHLTFEATLLREQCVAEGGTVLDVAGILRKHRHLLIRDNKYLELAESSFDVLLEKVKRLSLTCDIAELVN